MLCAIHGKEMRQNSKGFYCPTKLPDGGWCQFRGDGSPAPKPTTSQPTGWSKVREQAAQKVAPEKAAMTREDWEAKEARTNKNILLQVAFKAAVELCAAGKMPITSISSETLNYHQWLLSQTEGQKLAPGTDQPPIESFANDPEANKVDEIDF